MLKKWVPGTIIYNNYTTRYKIKASFFTRLHPQGKGGPEGTFCVGPRSFIK